MNPNTDKRVVMTLDAGGTSFRFSAIASGRAVTPMITVPSEADSLSKCLGNIVAGFSRVKAQCPRPPVAISFAFPGPADYPRGIIGDLGNLPAFRGGVALGPMLEDVFQVPVFINNDGDLFAYGEAIAGLLPEVNALLEQAGSQKRFNNLLGVTIGTGFGGGIVRHGELFIGDNSMAGEVWLLRNKLLPSRNAEEGASIRAVRRVYAEQSGIPFEQAPDPWGIELIAKGDAPGNRAAAIKAYRDLGEVVGDAMANALTLVDGLGVVGGGLSNGHALFFPRLIEELNGSFTRPDGAKLGRLALRAFNFEDERERRLFLKGAQKEIRVPGSERVLSYDPLQRIAIGVTRLGTSVAVAVGAYAFALGKLPCVPTPSDDQRGADACAPEA